MHPPLLSGLVEPDSRMIVKGVGVFWSALPDLNRSSTVRSYFSYCRRYRHSVTVTDSAFRGETMTLLSFICIIYNPFKKCL